MGTIILQSHVCPSTYSIIIQLDPGEGGGKFCHFHVSLLIIALLRIPYLLNFVKLDIKFSNILDPKFWAHSLFQNDIVTILSKHTNNSYKI